MKIICPTCQAVGETSRAFPTYSPKHLASPNARFWDEDGKPHFHDEGRRTSHYRCSKGHRWKIVERESCPSCEFGSEPAQIIIAD